VFSIILDCQTQHTDIRQLTSFQERLVADAQMNHRERDLKSLISILVMHSCRLFFVFHAWKQELQGPGLYRAAQDFADGAFSRVCDGWTEEVE
jgi:hypothetical protein